jgi:predicted ATPase/Tfp pilus assembly protein PilF
MAAEVFISYARTDRDQVLPWVGRLQQAGVSVWIDEAEIDPAELWSQEILAAVDACSVLLLLLSPASVTSKQVAREVTLASERNKPILPLLLEPTAVAGPVAYHLAGVQHLELFGADPEATLPALLRALARLGVAAAVEAKPAETGAMPAPGPTVPPAAQSAEPRAQSGRTAAHNLPEPLTSFIGREKEIAAVRERLSHSRLLTLTGAGGTGKTRLALQVAGELVAEYPDGVWLVELASLADPALVPQEVARALEVREEPGRPLIETLLGALRPRELLLVLDNCEHLVDACAELAHTLLRASPGVRLLATSRQALGVPGESLFRVPSLSAPAPPPPPVEQLTQYEAVRLFIDRAQLSQPSFAVTSANAPAVAEICHRLDGIPLAIELAAARVKLLSPEQIRTRLEDRFRLLTGGSRAVLPRHQTLQAALDWSYELLTAGEQALLRRLSVFVGGFSLEAAEAVCGGDEIDAYEVLDRLGQLVDKSLVQVDEPGSEGRYRMAETVRQYGLVKLRAAGEEAALRERHRDWYLALAEQAEPELEGPRQAEWLARLEAEHDNLRAALAWCVGRSEAVAGARLGWALGRFWYVRGHWSEGREQLASLLALPGMARTVERDRALHWAVTLAIQQGDCPAAWALAEESLVIQRELGDQQGIAKSLGSLALAATHQGEYETARALYEEGLAIVRQLGDQQEIAEALSGLATVAHFQGENEAARGLYKECLAIQRQLGNKRKIAYSLNNLGTVAYVQGDYEAARALYKECLAIDREVSGQQAIYYSLLNLGSVAADQGDYEVARALYEESLAICRQLGDQQGIAVSLLNLGEVAKNQRKYEEARALYEESLAIHGQLGNQHSVALSLLSLGEVANDQREYEEARALYEESLEICRQLGDKRGIAHSLHNLGLLANDQGDYPAARALYEEGLAIRRQLGNKRGTAYSLEGLAAVAGTQGQPERAARLFGAAEALREAIGAPLPPSDRTEHDRHVATARAALDEAAFAAAWAEGRALPLEQAIALALGDTRAG